MDLKKTKFILLVIIIFTCFPITAFANGPAPNPNDHDLLIDDIDNIDSLIVYGVDIDGKCGIIEDYPQGLKSSYMTEKTKIEMERIISIYNRDKQYTSFQLEIKFNDGTVVQSNTIEFIEWSNYKYSVKDNDLQPYGAFASRKPHGFTVIFLAIALIFPLGLTTLLEFLISLMFKIKPAKYVCIINAITNPIMNIIIVFGSLNFVINYYWLMFILEIIVLLFEYWYYSGKFEGIGKLKLLLFTITANAASWGAYALVSGLW